MTWAEAVRATRLGEELKNLRGVAEILQEQSSRVVTVKVDNLLRTYGIDRHTITFPYATARLQDMIAAEQDRIVKALADIGVDPPEPQP